MASERIRDECINVSDTDGTPLEKYVIPRCYENDLDTVLVSNGLIRDRIKKMAQIIHDDIGDKPLTCLCVLKGSYRFFTALTDELIHLRQQCENSLTPDFIRVQSYANTETTGKVDIIGWQHVVSLKQQNVLVVEDLVDTGLTMKCLLTRLEEESPKSVRVATLAVKRTEHTAKYQPDYVGFSLPDKFVVGFGLDYNQRMRDLNHICVMNNKGIEKYKQ